MNRSKHELTSEVAQNDPASGVVLLPIMAAIFGVYVVIGIAMPVLPLYVHQRLGFGPFVVGLVSGSQFAAGMLSRFWAGHHVDTRGAKHAVVIGLLVAALSGAFYLASSYFVQRGTSVTVLLAGRAVLGAAESFVITGALSLGLAWMGARNTGKVMAWVGTALYAGFASGAPVGTMIYGSYGFRAVAIGTALIPLCGLPLLAKVRPVARPHVERAPEIQASSPRRLGSRRWRCPGRSRLRCDQHVYRAALRRSRLDARVAAIHRP